MQETQQDVARGVVLLTLEEACARGGIGLTRAYKLLNDGAIDGVKVGKSTRVIEASLDRYIASLPRWKPTGRPVAVSVQPSTTKGEPAKSARRRSRNRTEATDARTS